MKTKRLNTILYIFNETSHFKRPWSVVGSGKSNDDAQEKCWRELKKQFNKEYSGCSFRVRAFNFEVI